MRHLLGRKTAVSGKSLDLAQLVEHTTVIVRSHCMVAGSIPAVER